MFSQKHSYLSLNHAYLFRDRRDEPRLGNPFQASDIMDFLIWNNWLIMALLTPVLWAVSCLIDVYFVGKGIFRYPSDGPIVSGLFCFFPLLLFVTEINGWERVTFSMMWPALLAGTCYFLHLYFVFKALFTINDVSCSETFNTLTVFFVPVLAFLVLGEQLAPIYYLAIILAVTGVLVLIRYHLSGVHRHAVGLLTMAVLCVSLTMVLQAWVFEHLDFWNGILLFALGMFLTTLLVIASQHGQSRRLIGLCRRFGSIFLLAECLQLVALMTSQRATQIGPSVSFVAIVECSLPLFVMIFSAVLSQISRHWNVMSSDMSDVLLLQMTSTPVKITSLALILCAILMVHTHMV